MDDFAKQFKEKRKHEIMKNRKADFDKQEQYQNEKSIERFLIHAWYSMAREVLRRFKMEMIENPCSLDDNVSWLYGYYTGCFNIDEFVKKVINETGKIGIQKFVGTFLSNVDKYEKEHPETTYYISRFANNDKTIFDNIDFISKEFVNLIAKEAKQDKSAFYFKTLLDNTEWWGGYQNTIKDLLNHKTDKDIIVIYDHSQMQNLLYYNYAPAMKKIEQEVANELKA